MSVGFNSVGKGNSSRQIPLSDFATGLRRINTDDLWKTWDRIVDTTDNTDENGQPLPDKSSDDLVTEFKRRKIQPPYRLIDIFINKSRATRVKRPDGVETLLSGSPTYQIRPEGFAKFYEDYKRHVELTEAHRRSLFRSGRLRFSRGSQTALARLHKYGFRQRAGTVYNLMVQIAAPKVQIIPFLNAELFRGKNSRPLFWKLADLAAREWLANSLTDNGGRKRGPDTATTDAHDTVRTEYRSVARTMPYDSHRARCREVLQRLNQPLTLKSIERICRPLAKL